ncbi:MAG: MATE family efflux transporter [Chloroflexota bacterium]
MDKAWLGVAFSFLSVTINIPTNYLLIHGIGSWEGLGLLGAGIASFLSLGAAFVAATLYWQFGSAMAEVRRSAIASLNEVVFQFKEGFPPALGYIANGGAYSLAGLMLGWFGATALAANQVVGSVSSVLYMLPLGMSAAVAIRVGQAVGASEVKRLNPIATAAIGVVIVWMGAATLGLLIAGPVIANTLADDMDVVTLATSMFVVVAAMQIMDGVQSTGFGMLRGIMDNRWSVIITLVGFWLVALPAAYIFGFVWNFGPNGVWIGYGVGLLPIAVALPVRFAMLTRQHGKQ